MYCMICTYYKKLPVLGGIFALLFMLIVTLLPGCANPKKNSPVPAPPQKIRIAIAGDLLMHMPVVNSDRDPKTGKYDFKESFIEIGPCLAEPDFTMINLETRLAGPSRGYSGFPRFNTPSALAEDLKVLGVDLVTTANNHSMDMGQDGVIKTLDALDRAGVPHTGTYRSPAERDTPVYFDINGIRVGFINYTQNTNGLPVPSNAGYMVNLIIRDQIMGEIDRLK
ncbi:MAG: CapA family protein, partial [Desulfocucumaceae bacterium]